MYPNASLRGKYRLLEYSVENTGVKRVSMKLAYLSRSQWTATWC